MGAGTAPRDRIARRYDVAVLTRADDAVVPGREREPSLRGSVAVQPTANTAIAIIRMTRRRGLRRVGRPVAAVRSVVMCFMGCSRLEIDSRVVGDHRFDAFTLAATRPLVIGAVPREPRGESPTNNRAAPGALG